MSGFSNIMRLKEMAEEDIYFARRDRELIAELKRRHGAAPDQNQSAATEKPKPPDSVN
jgi:hypothetical protein